MDNNIALKIIREHGSQCAEYHKHKETITWTALGLYLAFVTSIIGIVASNDLSNCEIIFLAGASGVISFLILIFVNRQLQWKAYELSAMNSANKLIVDVIAGKKTVEVNDCLIPEGEFLPKAILDEMGWAGSQRFDLKHVGVQKYTRIYANLFIVILTAFEIAFLLLLL